MLSFRSMGGACRRFEDFERAERQQADGRDREQHRAEGLVLHGAQHAGETGGLMRIGVVGGKSEKSADQQKDDGARENPERAGQHRPDAKLAADIEPLARRRAASLHRKPDSNTNEAGSDQGDDSPTRVAP